MNIKNEMWVSLKSLVLKKARTWWLKNLRLMIKIYKNLCLPVITWNKKHLSKLVVPLTYAQEKKFFEDATFNGL